VTRCPFFAKFFSPFERTKARNTTGEENQRERREREREEREEGRRERIRVYHHCFPLL
jgi:hypothetical protein